MNEENIFDLENIEDLPPQVRERFETNMVWGKFRPFTANVLRLFKIKNQLSVDELTISIYRKYKVEATKRKIYTTCMNLCQKNFLEKKGAIFELTEQAKKVLNIK